VNGESSALTADEIRNDGEKLFNTVVRDGVAELFDLVPKNTPIFSSTSMPPPGFSLMYM